MDLNLLKLIQKQKGWHPLIFVKIPHLCVCVCVHVCVSVCEYKKCCFMKNFHIDKNYIREPTRFLISITFSKGIYQ